MTTEGDKQAYLKAQKQRNLFIGLGLAAFVVLVFFVSMARMAQGLHHDNAARQAVKAQAMSSLASTPQASSH